MIRSLFAIIVESDRTDGLDRDHSGLQSEEIKINQRHSFPVEQLIGFNPKA